MEMNSKEPAPRIPLMLDIDYKKNYARVNEKGQLKNISTSGAFLAHQNKNLSVNDKVTLLLKVGGRERSVAAHVVWSNEVGCGVKFLPVNNRDIQIVDDLIYYVDSNRKNRRSIINNIFKHVA